MTIWPAILLLAAFDNATLRLFEQDDGPLLPFARRVHSTRFDAARTRVLGVEVSATYATPEATTTIPVACTLKMPDGSVIAAEGPIPFQLLPGRTQSESAALLWKTPAAQGWQIGEYEVECLAADERIGRVPFEIAVNPADVAEGDIRVAALRIFAVETNLPPRTQRSYAASLAADETRRIGLELEFSHAPLGRTPKIPVDCWFFWPDGQTSPPLVLNYEPQADWAGGYSAGAMGWEQPGSWLKGVYTVTCAIHGRPVAVERFDLT